ncbi:hypothetical protein E2320_009350 [Naja naja]|nr:hypothetical protein E2320_009350 [Naja naja]
MISKRWCSTETSHLTSDEAKSLLLLRVPPWHLQSSTWDGADGHIWKDQLHIPQAVHSLVPLAELELVRLELDFHLGRRVWLEAQFHAGTLGKEKTDTPFSEGFFLDEDLVNSVVGRWILGQEGCSDRALKQIPSSESMVSSKGGTGVELFWEANFNPNGKISTLFTKETFARKLSLDQKKMIRHGKRSRRNWGKEKTKQQEQRPLCLYLSIHLLGDQKLLSFFFSEEEVVHFFTVVDAGDGLAPRWKSIEREEALYLASSSTSLSVRCTLGTTMQFPVCQRPLCTKQLMDSAAGSTRHGASF